MFNKTEIVPKRSDTMTYFEAAFASIKSDLCDIADTYLCIAYKVHEIDVRIRKDGKKCKYKNIVEACETELGFKKSTTYNMLNIVKTYGVDDKGRISYQQLCTYSHYSYSQLVEMLSLGSAQRSEIKPDTSVSAIRMLKKSNEKDEPKTFQTSGKSDTSVEKTETFRTFGNSDHVYEIKSFFEDGELFIEVDDEFTEEVDVFTDDLCDFYSALGTASSQHYLTGADFESFPPDKLEERFKTIMAVYRQAYNSYYNQLERENKSAV